MAKVQVMEKSVRSMTVRHRNNFAKPKIHIYGRRANVKLKNLSAKNVQRHDEGTKNQRHSKRHPLERYITAAVHLLAFSLLSFMIFRETESYEKTPTSTSEEDGTYPVQAVAFPGIAICNINVISQRKANLLAEELWQKEEVKEIGNLTLETIKSLMKYMGHLYLFENWEEKPGEMMLLHEIMTTANTKNYDVLSIMEELIPMCQSLLKHCWWQGQYRQCHELFVSRWTQDGFCCTFNYIRWTDDFDGEQNDDVKFHVERSKISGVEYGLWVFLDPQLDDYYYNILPGRGFKVLIYTASDYPDAPSGGLKEILVSPRSEVFLSLSPTSFYSSPDVIRYDKKKRRCLFNTELHETYEGFYSYSQCMMLCRTRDILKICDCIPFFYPVPDGAGKVKICTLVDLACLKRNRYKWWSVEPTPSQFTDTPYAREEDEGIDAHLNCDCFPSCEHVDYHVFKTSGDINNPAVPLTVGETFNVSDNYTALSVSFGTSTGTVRVRQDVLFYWYDLMSSYGGLCSLFLGISIMTPIELIYLLCLKIFNQEKEDKSPETRHSSEAIKSKLDDRKIYWNEIALTK